MYYFWNITGRVYVVCSKISVSIFVTDLLNEENVIFLQEKKLLNNLYHIIILFCSRHYWPKNSKIDSVDPYGARG